MGAVEEGYGAVGKKRGGDLVVRRADVGFNNKYWRFLLNYHTID